MKFHVDAAAAKGDAFGFEAETLLKSRLAAEFDFSAGTENALPGQSDGPAQDADDLAGGAGMSSSTGDRAVS